MFGIFGKKDDKEVRTNERKFARASAARSPRAERVARANGDADCRSIPARRWRPLRRSILGSSRGCRARGARAVGSSALAIDAHVLCSSRDVACDAKTPSRGGARGALRCRPFAVDDCDPASVSANGRANASEDDETDDATS